MQSAVPNLNHDVFDAFHAHNSTPWDDFHVFTIRFFILSVVFTDTHYNHVFSNDDLDFIKESARRAPWLGFSLAPFWLRDAWVQICNRWGGEARTLSLTWARRGDVKIRQEAMFHEVICTVGAKSEEEFVWVCAFTSSKQQPRSWIMRHKISQPWKLWVMSYLVLKETVVRFPLEIERNSFQSL